LTKHRELTLNWGYKAFFKARGVKKVERTLWPMNT
jgi:hypothetical protein